MRLARGSLFMNLSYHIHTHPIFRSRVFFSHFCFSPSASFFSCSGSEWDEEKRDAIKMKLVPKRRPKAKFHVRQPCRMCIYSLTGHSGSIDIANNWHHIHKHKHSKAGEHFISNFLDRYFSWGKRTKFFHPRPQRTIFSINLI